MEHVAFLIEETNERIEALLNPESLVVRRRAGVRSRRSPTGELAGAARKDDPLVYTGGGRTEIELDLLFDTDLAGSTIAADDVRDLTRPLWDLTEKAEDTTPRPLLVRFVWGKSWNVPGVVVRVAERLERFTESGAPQRSWLKMEFLRVDMDPNVQPAPPITPPVSPEEAAELTDNETPTHELVGGGAAPNGEETDWTGSPDADALLESAMDESGLNAALSAAEREMTALRGATAELFPPEAYEDSEDTEGGVPLAEEETSEAGEAVDEPGPLADSAEAPDADEIDAAPVEAPEAQETSWPSVASVRVAVAASAQAVSVASVSRRRDVVAATLHAAQMASGGAERARVAASETAQAEGSAHQTETVAGTLERISDTLSNAAAAAVAAVRERAATLVAEATLALNSTVEADTAELDRLVARGASEAPEAQEGVELSGEVAEAEEVAEDAEHSTTEEERVEAETERARAEARRAQAEADRAEAEAERAQAETERAQAETEQARAETVQATALREDLAQMRALLARTAPTTEPLAPARPAQPSELADVLGELGTVLQTLHARREEDAAALATRLIEANASALRDLRAAEEAQAAASYRPTAVSLAEAADDVERALAPEAPDAPSEARSADEALSAIERGVASVRAPAESAALEPARQAAQQLRAHLALNPEASGDAATRKALDTIRAAPEAIARAEEAAGAEAAQATTARLAEARRAATPEATSASREKPPSPELRASGGAVTVQLGERLEHAAFRYYRDPALWRMLAHANDLDDPLRLPAGLMLRIPSAQSA